ncbi:LysR substrate-binding domain-containing protein [Streptomyces sp. ID05-26A]|nr:LysR substrate-binding domain-containing protein [Streptomyces sp. ID05-26A]
MTALRVVHETSSSPVPAWDDLRAFLAVARMRNFTRAAVELHTSQPTVTRQVQRLERQLGTRLFGRNRREVWLTAEGQSLLTWVEQMNDSALRGVAACKQPFPAEVHLAAYSHALSQLVEQLKGEAPDVEWHAATLPPETALQALARDEIHAAICYTTTSPHLAQSPPLPTGVAVRRLVREPVWLAIPLTHPLSSRTEIVPRELAREKWISPGRGPMRELLEEMCSAAGFVPDVRHVAEDRSTAGALLAGGSAISLSSATIDTRGEFLVKPLKDGPARWIYVAWKPERLRPPAATVVLAAARLWYQRRAARNPAYLDRLRAELGSMS